METQEFTIAGIAVPNDPDEFDLESLTDRHGVTKVAPDNNYFVFNTKVEAAGEEDARRTIIHLWMEKEVRIQELYNITNLGQ